MASDFCNIPPKDQTKQILSLLPPLPSIQRLVNVILQKVNDVKSKYTAKIEEFISQFELGCPTPQEIEKIIIYNSQGQVINEVNYPESTVDVSNLIRGIYWIKSNYRKRIVFKENSKGITCYRLIANTPFL